LLVAAHIEPRRLLDDATRNRLGEVAMLMCALGCDALFERGLIVVDPDGLVAAGAVPSGTDVDNAVNNLIGRRCSAFRRATAPRFAAHAVLARA
jgi:hypothetical protein